MSQSAPQKSAYRPRPVSGFPELLPAQRLAEQHWLDQIRRVFESYGFASIETPSVEELDVLLAKGETDKEIYVLERLQAEENSGKEARLGLHYDLTVPFARYVAQHFNELSFPFKRYQMQRVWRGERPQEGRFREFQQCDIDVIGVDNLSLSFDAELPAIVIEALSALGVGDVKLHISNRKILDGALRTLGVEDRIDAIRIVDKRGKWSDSQILTALATGFILNGVEDPHEKARNLTRMCGIETPDNSYADRVKELFPVMHPVLEEGLNELAFVMRTMATLGVKNVVADMSLARGFDYYTGTVYEGRFMNYPGFGSVVAGGRYDDLAGSFINKKLPGVGISLGFSRLFHKLLAEGRVAVGPSSPTQVLVVLPSDERHDLALTTAQSLRSRGLRVETYHAAQKLQRQLGYAEKKGIPFVWFPPFEDGADHAVKDMATGNQVPADPATWSPGA